MLQKSHFGSFFFSIKKILYFDPLFVFCAKPFLNLFLVRRLFLGFLIRKNEPTEKITLPISGYSNPFSLSYCTTESLLSLLGVPGSPNSVSQQEQFSEKTPDPLAFLKSQTLLFLTNIVFLADNPNNPLIRLENFFVSAYLPFIWEYCLNRPHLKQSLFGTSKTTFSEFEPVCPCQHHHGQRR